MRYGMSIDDGEALVGTRDEIAAAVAGAMLATGYDSKDPSAREKAALVMDFTDTAARKGETQGLLLHDPELDHEQDLTVWRERGDAVTPRRYLVKVGTRGSLFQTSDPTVLVTYLTGLMVADSVGVERANALGENVAFTLSEGGGYPGHEVTELRDKRTVYAWQEEVK